MAVNKITWQGVSIRFFVAVVLVFCTYNPHEKSYFHWVKTYLTPASETHTSLALLVFAGIVLIIGWTVYLRATMRSLGLFGLLLTASFFAALLWLVVDFKLISLENTTLVIDLVLILLAAVLATGITWSHIRRRISGQADVDDVDET